MTPTLPRVQEFNRRCKTALQILDLLVYLHPDRLERLRCRVDFPLPSFDAGHQAAKGAGGFNGRLLRSFTMARAI